MNANRELLGKTATKVIVKWLKVLQVRLKRITALMHSLCLMVTQALIILTKGCNCVNEITAHVPVGCGVYTLPSRVYTALYSAQSRVHSTHCEHCVRIRSCSFQRIAYATLYLTHGI